MGRRTRRTSRVAVSALCVALFLSASIVFAQAKPFEELVPEDCTHFLCVKNYRASMNKLKATPYDALLKEPEVKALIDQAVDAMSEGLAEMKTAVGYEPADIEKLLSGEIALAMIQQVQPGQMQGGEIWGLLLADLGPHAQKAATMLDTTLKRATEDENVTVTKEEFRGHTIQRLSFAKKMTTAMSEEEINKLDPELQKLVREAQAREKQEKGEAGESVYVSLEGSILAVAFGKDRSLLERHFVLRDGGDIKPLKRNEAYGAVMAQLGAQNDYTSFQSFERLWKAFKESSAGGMTPFDAPRLVEEMGVFDLKAQGGALRIGQNGLSSQAFVLVPAPRKGVLKALVPTERVKVAPPAFVGRDAALYMGVYFDVPVFWAEMKEAIRKVAPDQAQGLDMMLNNPESPVQPERDLINSLGSHWYVYLPEELYVPAAQGKPAEVNFVLAVELKDQPAFHNGFQQVTSMFLPPDKQMKRVPFMGVTIYETAEFGGPEFKMSLRFVFLHDTLLITSSEAMAKQCVQLSKKGRSALLSKPEFASTLRQLPRGYEGILYADQRHIGEWAYKLVGWALVRGNVADVKLPRWETLSKYLYVSTSVMKWNEQGLKTTSWQPYPPKKP